MKKKHLLGLLLMAMAVGVGFVSCERDDGSEGIEFRMRNSDNGNDIISLLQVDTSYYIGETFVHEKYRTTLYLTSSNNFKVIESWEIVSIFYDTYDGHIACIGNVNSLSKIKTIPNSGWTSEVAVHPGQGYVIQNKHGDFCRYARLYVEDWIESTDGGIIGAVIRYQDNWKIEE